MGSNATEYVYNCAGDLVAVESGFFTNRCPTGNLEDYTNAHKSFRIDEIASNLDLRNNNLIIPVCCVKEPIVDVVESLLDQRFDDDKQVEIIFAINRPPDLTSTLLLKEKLNKNTLRYIFNKMRHNPLSDHELSIKATELRKKFARDHDQASVLILSQTIRNRMGEIYQRVISSFMLRALNIVSSSRIKSRDETDREIDEMMDNTVLLFWDDDIMTKDELAVKKTYDSCVKDSKVVFGRVKITEVSSENQKLDECLRVIMQCFFEFKEDLGIGYLSPRAAKLKGFHHVADVNLKQPYSDQVYFANIARNKKITKINVTTTLEEEDYPSNSKFMKDLRMFLEYKKDESALSMLKNVLGSYGKYKNDTKYSKEEIKSFIDLIRGREAPKITSFGNELLRKSDLF